MAVMDLKMVSLKAQLSHLVKLGRNFERQVEGLAWRTRWKLRDFDRSPKPQTIEGFKMESLKTIVISLQSRADRRAQFTHAMSNFGHTNFEFLDAVDGRINFPNLATHKAATKGCSESHRLGLERFSSDDFDAVMVCEDDIEFLRGKTQVEAAITEFMNDNRLDVLCLSARVRGSRKAISEELSIATRIVTGACYVVKPSAIEKLKKSFRESSRRVTQGQKKAALDQHWHKLQRGSLFFAVPNQKTVKIVAGYSDIQGKFLPDVI